MYLKEKKYLSIGIVPSYLYTVIYISLNGKIIDFTFFKNIEFASKITFELDFLLKDFSTNDLSYLSIFTGPSTLMTYRTAHAFLKGISDSLNIPIILLDGVLYYSKDTIISLVSIFSEKYILLENKKEFLLNENEILNLDLKNIFIATNNILKMNNNKNISGFILFPNLENISIDSYNKFLN
jgi:hypothetical protein